MDSPAAAQQDDLSALAWVHGELRRSLESAHKALRRYIKEAEAASGSDVDAVDPAVLRNARSQLHQGVGALELVGLPAAADVLRASEAAVQRMVARPALVDMAAVETIERVSFALLDFLARQLAGKPVSPLMLFPQYRSALQLAAADRIHPGDLWKIDWRWRELPADGGALPRAADDEARTAMETLVLSLLREPGRQSLTHLSDFCADLGAGARQVAVGAPHTATFWQLAAAVFEAQAEGLLAADVYSKRIASRLIAQLRMRSRGVYELSDRLAQDLLFFCSHARAPDASHPAPRLAAVRSAWRLDSQPTADYETPRLGRFDPAVLALARKRVAAAKDSWSAVAGDELHRLATIADQFVLVGESLQRLFPSGEVLAASLQKAVAQTVSSSSAPPPTLAMEVATSMLYLDASLEDGEFDHPELADRIEHLARRIDDVRVGAEPQPLDDWMEELYRRVSDRQTMGSVVQELRASLSEVEKQIDLYFRDPSQRAVLIPVPGELSAMRGVLSVLGLEQASAAALHMRDEVDALAQTEVDPQQAVQTGTFDRLADNLGALSFLIDMLSVQPQLAKSLFRFDAETGSLSAVMGQRERVSAFAAFDAAPGAAAAAVVERPVARAPLLEQLQALAADAARPESADADLVQRLEALTPQAQAADQRELARSLASAQKALRGVDAGVEVDADADAERRRQARAELIAAVAALAPPSAPEMPPAAPIPLSKPPVAGSTGLEDDIEMREIFLEEAREVVIEARAAIDRLADAPDSEADMTALRRGFHTLKGSGRMVGLRDFGEAAWAAEQLFNDRLAQAPDMDGALRAFSAEAVSYLEGWTEAIASSEDRGHNAADVVRAADSLRLDGVRLPIAVPAGGPSLPAVAATVLSLAADEATRSGPAAPIGADEPAEPLLQTSLASPSLPLTELPVAATVEFEFDLREGAGGAPQEALNEAFNEAFASDAFAPLLPSAEGRAGAFDTLAARVPGLPSAADLDFGLPEPVAVEKTTPLTLDAADALSFELDLDLGDLEASADIIANTAAAADFTAADMAAGTTADPANAAPTSRVDETPPFSIDQEGAAHLLVLSLDEPAAAEAVLPVPEVEAEIDIDELGDVFDSRFDEAQVGEAAAEPAALSGEAASEGPGDDDQVKVIGSLRIGIPLFNIYLNEADELSRRLGIELAEWGLEFERHPVPESSAALAHSLAGNSGTVGYTELSTLARGLEHALMRSHANGCGREGEPDLFNHVAEEIRRLLHQFAAGFLRTVAPGLTERLADHERWPLTPAPVLVPPAKPPALEFSAPLDNSAALPLDSTFEADIDAVDAIDAELFPFFEEEADELLPQLQTRLRDWHGRPHDAGAAMACMRTLHTLKGGARLAGAMRLGEMTHELETAIEALAVQGHIDAADIEPLLARGDVMSATYEALRRGPTPPAEAETAAVAVPAVPSAQTVAEPAPQESASLQLDASDVVGPASEVLPAPTPTASSAADALAPSLSPSPPSPLPAPPQSGAADGSLDPAAAKSTPAAAEPPPIDWQRFVAAEAGAAELAAEGAPAVERSPSGGALVRVRAGLLDRLVNDAGEVSITRARIDADVKVLQGSLVELTDSLERMRRQLRDIELQAETQIASRLEAAKAASASFDPLEMDRFTRFQELTRFMAESVNDVATLQRGLQRTLQSTEDQLAAQARLTRELQDDLLRTRMVEFESLADRLYRTARQAAKETSRQVRLEIVGGSIEVDRGVLERMAGSFEHLLRNSVVHGVEAPAARTAAGKDVSGLITITVAQSGNEVAVEFADDGAGLDLARIRRRAVERGLLAEDAEASDTELAQLIFQSGFSTAETVTELAGRGVGLDVVRAEVNAMGGRIETISQPGQGTRFKLLLPLTTAVTQVVMLRCGGMQVAVPSPLVEIVRRVSSAEIERAYAENSIEYGGETVPFYWLAALLNESGRGQTAGRQQTLVVVRSASQRVAVHVDEVLGNQEVVVKNVGPQLARLPGLAGVTLLPSGAVALIYNPVALASLYGAAAHQQMRHHSDGALNAGGGGAAPAAAAALAPLVMVVDDSLTVRRITQRLLVREGYRVVTAKDGLEALERLAEERPVVLLSDIEMPRMDGFDLLRNVRADERLEGLPVVMITSRIAQKHRDHAAELGVDHYLGKPYSEEELLLLVARYAGADIAA